MQKQIVIGIDVGGSTTKIVGFHIATHALIEPLFVRATDPITSAYGAFGKFLVVNHLTLSDIAKVMITGVGSSYLTDSLYDLPFERIEEFRAIGLGGLYLSGLSEGIIASCGTGTALVYAKEGEAPLYLGGTGVGGGTLLGLSKRLLGMDNIAHIVDIASEGDLSHVDLKINDITKHDIVPGFSDTMTASNFGNVSDIATRGDIALALINMVFETIGMVSIFAARNYNIRDVVLTGNLSSVPQSEEIFGTLNRMFDMRFTIPQNSRFGTVIGAALAGM